MTTAGARRASGARPAARWSALLAGGALLAASASGGLAAPAGAESGARLGELEAELRSTLEEYFVHVLERELALDDETAERVRPRLSRYLQVQRDASARRETLRQRLRAVVAPGREDPRTAEQLVRELLEADEEATESTFAARAEILGELEPRRRVAFLVFAERFREEVQRHVRAVKRGASAASGAPVEAPGFPARATPEVRPGGPEPRRDAAADRSRPLRDRAGSGRPGGGRPPVQGPAAARRLAEHRDDLVALLSLELRRRAELSVEDLLELLPSLERLVDAQVQSHQTRIGATRRLHRAVVAGGPGRGAMDDARVEGLVDRVDAHQRRVQAELLAARREVVEALPPIAAGRFLLLSARFQEGAGHRLRMLQRLRARPGLDGGR